VSIKRVALWGSAVMVLAVLLLVPALLAGVRIFAVQTPSMGQVAPVGTLVLTTRQSNYVSGDIISFSSGQVSHTHRIVRVQADGSFITKGDLNGTEDPLPAKPGDVIGKVVVIVPALGWLIAGMPWLLLGSIAVNLLTRIGRMPHHLQVALRIAGTTLIFCLVVLFLRPWLNINMLGFTPAPDGNGVLMHIVNTGMFPLDALGVRSVSGQDAVVHVVQAAGDGRFVLTPTPSLEWWQLVLMGLICLAPMVASLLIRVDQHPGKRHVPVRRPLATVVAIVVAATLAVFAFTLPKAFASTTAKVNPSVSSVGSQTFFNCRNAVTSLRPAGSVFVAFAMGTTTATETDLSNNGRTGAYASTVTTSTDVGCDHDSPARSVAFNGTSQCLYMNSDASTQASPNVFSVEAWFRTATKSNAKIIGFSNGRTAVDDGAHDRHIYIDKDGRIVFGVYNGATRIASTAAGRNYADNVWHHVVGTLSSAGQKLYVDGTLVMTNAAVTTGETNTGYWKVGCGAVTNWQNADSTGYTSPRYFTGWIQYAAVYSVALNATQVKEHYEAS